jgi:hypothetical protein
VVQAASPPMLALNTRPGHALASVAASLGPLTDLAGTWIGKGINPNFLGVNWPHISVATLIKQ